MAAALHSLFKILGRVPFRAALACMLAYLSICSAAAVAQAESSEVAPLQVTETKSKGYLARIGYNDPGQLNEALERIKDYFEETGSEGSIPPITMVVHGPEVEIFEQTNYETYKPIVDKAAELSALGVLDIAVCETRVRYRGLDADKVYAFVDKVPFGPSEVNRLLNDESYIYF